ncbi:MAG: phytanoyl-CoA dioxygenase family protein [Chloroflexota bacterium]
MAPSLELTHYPDLESQVTAIENDGFAYFPNYLSKDEVAELRELMDRTEANPDYFDRAKSAENGDFYERHLNNAFNRDPIYLNFIDKPGIIELAEAILGQDCHIIGMTAWKTGPGRPDQNLHADYLPISLPADIMADPRVKVPIFIMTMHYYLDDLTEELGPTQFIPGSHASGRRPDGDLEWKGVGPHNIMCNAGDGLMFRSEVWHRGTANKSDKIRYLLQVHYAQRMVTQKFPPYLHKFGFDEVILGQATPRQKRLLGDHKKGAYD